MNLNLSDEQQLLRSSFAKFFGAQSGAARVRAAEPLGFDASLWRELVILGAPMLRVPESLGGGGGSVLDAAIVAEEAGRHLASAPLLEAIVGAHLLAQIGGSPANEWLARIRSGTAIVTLALHPVRAGQQQLAPAAAVADALLCLEGDRIVLVTTPASMQPPADHAGLPLGWCDPSETAAGCERLTLVAGAEAKHKYLAAREEWKLLRAALLCGLSRRAIEMAAAYACERVQFGRPIGGFQAVAHPLADSATELDGAQLLVWRAISGIAHADVHAAALVSMASWWAREASGRAAIRALRVFGGYGLSLEYDIQLYFRRARSWALLDGDPQTELLDVADRLWPEPPEKGRTIPLPAVGRIDIDFSYGAKAERYAEHAREFFQTHLTAELRSCADYHSWNGVDTDFHRRLAQAGLGGQNRDACEMAALGEVFHEAQWSRHALVVTKMIVLMLARFGSPWIKEQILPALESGAAIGTLALTEPMAGSDVFATATRAVRNGDAWTISGRKVFHSGADVATHALVMARTDQSATGQRGLTAFLMPLHLAGIVVSRIATLAGEGTCNTELTNVAVPDEYRIGEVDAAVEVLKASLGQEHAATSHHLSQRRTLDQALQWARSGQHGERPIEGLTVRRRLARAAVHTHVAEVLYRRGVWAAAAGIAANEWGPMSKLFATEAYIKDSADLMALMAPASIMQGQPDTCDVERAHRYSVGAAIQGGTSEVLRGIIAQRALGLPRSR